jgi:hypothetical protein
MRDPQSLHHRLRLGRPRLTNLERLFEQAKLIAEAGVFVPEDQAVDRRALLTSAMLRMRSDRPPAFAAAPAQRRAPRIA